MENFFNFFHAMENDSDTSFLLPWIGPPTTLRRWRPRSARLSEINAPAPTKTPNENGTHTGNVTPSMNDMTRLRDPFPVRNRKWTRKNAKGMPRRDRAA